MSKIRKKKSIRVITFVLATTSAIPAFVPSHWKGNSQSRVGSASAFSPQQSRFIAFRSHHSKHIGPGHPPHDFDCSPGLSTSSTTALSLSFRKTFDSFMSRNKLKIALVVVLALSLGIESATIVEAGEIGIASTFGNLERFDPGLHFRFPILTSVTPLSTKTELLEQSNFVPTKEGLTVELDTAVLVKLNSELAIDLYRSVGPDFMRKLVAPETSSSVRGLTSESEAKALYTSGRSELQNRMKSELIEKLEPRGIMVEDVLLKNVVLPKSLSDSIQEKARAEQESARMEFVLLKETKEAERKAIEAEGIAEFQRIVSKGITPSLLQWKGIEATEKLSKSDNAKIVIMGNSKDSLPVILGGDSSGK